MGLTCLQVCMDSSDWFQGGAMHNNEDETGMGSSSSPSDMDMLTCTRPNNNMNMMERRLRPPHDQALKCPRCDSTHTKFCYYNNYSLSQPRYFCKTCRRYWTKGGSLRNIPVGGACRKTKKASDHSPITTPTDLHLSALLNPNNFKYNVNAAMLNDNIVHNQQPWPVSTTSTPVDFMMMGQPSRNNYDHHFVAAGSFNNLTSPFGTVMMDHLNTSNNNNNVNVGGSASFTDSRLMLPYEDHDDQNAALMDVKPKLLSLQWHDHQQQQNGCTENTITAKDSFGYLGIGSLSTGMINVYGSSTTNPLI